MNMLLNMLRAVMVVACLSAASLAQAEGVIQRVPEDGTWVRYHVAWKISGDLVNQRQGTGTWTIRLVGTRTVNDIRCRWIEFEERLSVDGASDAGEPTVEKFLVPEHSLQPGGNPLNDVIRFWVGSKDGTPEKLEGPWSGIAESVFLPASKRMEQGLEPRIVEYQRGKLETGPGLIEQAHPTDRRGRQATIDYHLWKHPEVPIGTAAARIELTIPIDAELRWRWVRELTVLDFGTGAKSSLPECD